MYPGLWLCLLITIGILTYFGYINHTNIFSRQFWLWLGTQVSFLQFYTPDMFRHFGVRNPNGALWTIPVEISFYFFHPLSFLAVPENTHQPECMDHHMDGYICCLQHFLPAL